MLKKIFNSVFGIAESTVKESLDDTRRMVKFYALGTFVLIALFVFTIIACLIKLIF